MGAHTNTHRTVTNDEDETEEDEPISFWNVPEGHGWQALYPTPFLPSSLYVPATQAGGS